MTKTEIFVFGSNLQGVHGKGAALTARNKYGAVLGVGVGRTGNAYAIPTKAKPTRGTGDTLPLYTIQQYVEEFLDYARERPNLQFKVTAIGCGLAGYDPNDIGPMFAKAPANVRLPPEFSPHRRNGLWLK